MVGCEDKGIIRGNDLGKSSVRGKKMGRVSGQIKGDSDGCSAVIALHYSK